MRLWIDDVRPAPEGYVWCRNVKEAKWRIETAEDICTIFPLVDEKPPIELIDIDHDAGDYANDGKEIYKCQNNIVLKSGVKENLRLNYIKLVAVKDLQYNG